VANDHATAVSVLRNLGNGTFAPQVTYFAGNAQTSVTTGDFDRDRQLDLAVANSTTPGTVSVLLQFRKPDAPPTDITLSGSIVPLNQPVGAIVGTLASADSDLPGESFTYSLVTGTGGTDNGLFAISGNTLQTAKPLDGTQSLYSIRIRTTDSGGLYYDKILTLRSALPGDANLDGVVDFTDLSRLLTNFDKGGMTWNGGDFDGNGSVDFADLSKLLTNFDKGLGAAAGLKGEEGKTSAGGGTAMRVTASVPPDAPNMVSRASVRKDMRSDAAIDEFLLRSWALERSLDDLDSLDEVAGLIDGRHGSKRCKGTL
jgi:hypothetical protein